MSQRSKRVASNSHDRQEYRSEMKKSRNGIDIYQYGVLPFSLRLIEITFFTKSLGDSKFRKPDVINDFFH